MKFDADEVGWMLVVWLLEKTPYSSAYENLMDFLRTSCKT